jgi:hypothetical protein
LLKAAGLSWHPEAQPEKKDPEQVSLKKVGNHQSNSRLAE